MWPHQRCPRADPNSKLWRMRSSWLIKAQNLMRRGPRQTVLCKLHHLRDTVPFPRMPLRRNSSFHLSPGQEVMCTASSQQFTMVRAGSLPRSKGSFSAEQGSLCLPAPGQDGCGFFPFLLSMGSTQVKACSWQMLVPVHFSLSFAIPVLFTHVKALTRTLGDGLAACPSLAQQRNPLQ